MVLGRHFFGLAAFPFLTSVSGPRIPHEPHVTCQPWCPALRLSATGWPRTDKNVSYVFWMAVAFFYYYRYFSQLFLEPKCVWSCEGEQLCFHSELEQSSESSPKRRPLRLLMRAYSRRLCFLLNHREVYVLLDGLLVSFHKASEKKEEADFLRHFP